MKILILGVNGFIGHHLVNRILAEKPDWQVSGMDLGAERIGPALNNPRFNFLEGDISINKEWIEYHIKKCDVIMPLVGMLIGGIDLSQLDIVLKPAVMNGDEVVTAAVTLGIGTFLTTIIDFILVALVIFIMIKAINRFHKKKEEAPAPEEPKGPTSEELLTEIRDLLKEKNQ